ncbi:MAG: phosphodiesterase, partial [Myxococcota bacterium]|jgi:predicted MPP superfamily phosphohydrolase|nr:phosphodiesterase [Myxococcota bacterium]
MPFAEEEHGFLVDALGSIEAPVFCCAGNHDLPVLDRLVEELEAVGAPLLVDESRSVRLGQDVVEVVGVNFHWRDARGELLAAIEGLPPTSAGYRILMAHDPRLFGWVPEGRFDLVLSGHTHGGQVGTNMFGIPWSVLRLFGVYDQGFFHRGPSRLYVHSGNWFTGLPPRMGIAGEVAVHRLV